MLKKWLQKFEEYLHVNRYAALTVRTYIACVRQFFLFLSERGIRSISEITKDRIKEYQNFIFYFKRGDKALTLVTQAAKINAVKTFCKFLVKESYLLYDPSCDIELPKTPRQVPREILSEKEIVKLFSAPDLNTPLGMRDRAILEMFYSTGMRNTELRDLTLTDLNMRQGTVRISRGKGGKARIVPMGEAAAYYLSLYITKSRPHLSKDNETQKIFLSIRGGELSRCMLPEMVQKYASMAKIRKRIGCHTLRHTCATHMLKGHADLRYIQELLGHESLATTQIYTKVEISDLRRVHKMCHPRNRL